MKNPQLWIPFITWIISVILVSLLIIAFYELSSALSFIYAVIISTAFYVMFKTRKAGKNK